MGDPVAQLHAAIRGMDLQAIGAALQAGADANARLPEPLLGWAPLHYAALLGSVQATALLLAAGADPGAVASVRLARGEPGFPPGTAPEARFEDATPLHLAIMAGAADVVGALLAAAPQVALRRAGIRILRPAQAAAGKAAAPPVPQGQAALEGNGAAALQQAGSGQLAGTAGTSAAFAAAFTARCTLELSLLRGCLAGTLRLLSCVPPPLLRPLLEQVQPPCPGLGVLLAAVLSRCPLAARALVARLPAADRQRLRTALLCLERLQRLQGRRLPPKFAAAALTLALAP